LLSAYIRNLTLALALVFQCVFVSSSYSQQIELIPPPGQYPDSVLVDINAPHGWVLYYTLDGSAPTVNSSVYSISILIEDDTVLRYLAVQPGKSPGRTGEAFYGITGKPVGKKPVRSRADPPGGLYSKPVRVRLLGRDGTTIYYTIDGSEPTTQSAVYEVPLTLASDATLKFFSVDSSGEREEIQEVNYIFRLTEQMVDTTPPVVEAVPAPSDFTGLEPVRLVADEECTIYYTLDGTKPTRESSRYTHPLQLGPDTRIRFYARDLFGNTCPVQTLDYTVDIEPPSTTASPQGGFYKSRVDVTLAASETGAIIYYTLDSSDPTRTSKVYTGPIHIDSDSLLRYFAVDRSGNAEIVRTAEYRFKNKPPVTRTTPPEGEYYPPISVSLATEQGSVIHFTTDGSDPDLYSPLYSREIVLPRGGVLKFFAVSSDGTREKVQERHFDLVRGVWRKYARGVFIIPSATDGKVFWMGTETGLVRYQVGSGSRKFVGEGEGLLGSQINDLILDEAGQLWVATDLGLNRYVENNGFIRFDQDGGMPGRDVVSLAADKDNTVWAGTRDGAAHLKGDVILEILDRKDGLPDDGVLSIAVDGLGNKWFGTRKGLAIFDGNTFRTFTKDDGLIHNEVRAVAIDSDWNIWCGTPKGVSVFNGTDWKSYTRKDGLPSNSIMLIAPDPDGDVWVATRAGVVRFSGGKWIREESP